MRRPSMQPMLIIHRPIAHLLRVWKQGSSFEVGWESSGWELVLFANWVELRGGLNLTSVLLSKHLASLKICQLWLANVHCIEKCFNWDKEPTSANCSPKRRLGRRVSSRSKDLRKA